MQWKILNNKRTISSVGVIEKTSEFREKPNDIQREAERDGDRYVRGEGAIPSPFFSQVQGGAEGQVDGRGVRQLLICFSL